MGAVLEQITIFAPGLLGGSLAMSLRQRGLCRRVHLWGRRPESLAGCVGLSWCDAVYTDAEAAVAGSDWVVLCSPVEAMPELLEQMRAGLQAGALVTDVGSTKAWVCGECRRLVPAGVQFIGSHPMAGSELTGWRNGSATLFEGRPCLVTPFAEDTAEAVARVVQFWQQLGMQVHLLSAEAHDEIVAGISHLPHLLATVLAAQFHAKDPLWGQLSGNGFRDMTRIAAGSPELWEGIFRQNREQLLLALGEFEASLGAFKEALIHSDWSRVLELLQAGKEFREGLR